MQKSEDNHSPGTAESLEENLRKWKPGPGPKFSVFIWVNPGLHPNIGNCYYVRRIGGNPHLFTEFMDAGDLSGWIGDGRLYGGGHEKALEPMLDIAVQSARSLSHAHDRGIVHQDVKPGNLMMLKDGTG